MPSLLVLIRKPRWYATAPPFRGVPDIPADCLADLRIENNELSAWLVDDQQANLNRILTALAATRDSLSNVDYIIFDFGLPGKLNITVRQTKGETPDNHANRSWHYDLTGLSARQVVELAVDMHSSGKKDRLLPRKVSQLIEESVKSGDLDQTKIKAKLALRLFGSSTQPLWRRILKRLWRSGP